MKNSYKLFLASFIFLLIQSCCDIHNEATYKFNGVEIKRVDVCGKTTFQYLSKDGENYGKIYATYSGINDGFSGYLIFGKKNKVTILVGDGYFQRENVDTSKFSLVYYLDSTFQKRNLWNITDSPNVNKFVYIITSPIEYEKKKNADSKTEVKVKYNITK